MATSHAYAGFTPPCTSLINVTSDFRGSVFTFFTYKCTQEEKTEVAIYAMTQEHCKLCLLHIFSLLVIIVFSIAAMIIMYRYSYENVL